MTTSKPPLAKTCGNSACQLKALSPAISGSLMSELPHLILLLSEFSLRCGLAVRSHNANLAISTLSSLMSTPYRLFSKMLFSTPGNSIAEPVILASISSSNLCSSMRKRSAALRKAPLPQAGSQIVMPNSHSRYLVKFSNNRFLVAVWRFLSAKYSASSISISVFFSVQSRPTVFSTMYLVIYCGV